MKSARVAAMDFLARREHGRQELINKLTAKGYACDEVEAAIDRLAHEGLQSDQRFTQSYIRSRMRAGLGPKRIQMELQQKGLAAELVAEYLQADEINWWENLQAAWQKKFNVMPVGAKEYARQLRFLMQRGFESEHIHALLKTHN